MSRMLYATRCTCGGWLAGVVEGDEPRIVWTHREAPAEPHEPAPGWFEVDEALSALTMPPGPLFMAPGP